MALVAPEPGLGGRPAAVAQPVSREGAGRKAEGEVGCICCDSGDGAARGSSAGLGGCENRHLSREGMCSVAFPCVISCL